VATVRRDADTGQAATELALALPFLCALLIGVIQFGSMIATYMDLTSATRDGARRAASARHDASPTLSVRESFLESLDRADPNDVTLGVYGGWRQDDRVTVTATMPYELDIFGWVVWEGDLRSSSIVRIG
jgi:Flp pilus assembly protein TadG